jgi:hypothetical protein
MLCAKWCIHLTHVAEVCGTQQQAGPCPHAYSHVLFMDWFFCSMRRQWSWLNVCILLHNAVLQDRFSGVVELFSSSLHLRDLFTCKIWGSHGCDFEEQWNLRCDAASSSRYLPTFRKNLLPPSTLKVWVEESSGTLTNICHNYTASHSRSQESSEYFFWTEVVVAELHIRVHTHT